MSHQVLHVDGSEFADPQKGVAAEAQQRGVAQAEQRALCRRQAGGRVDVAPSQAVHLTASSLGVLPLQGAEGAGRQTSARILSVGETRGGADRGVNQ